MATPLGKSISSAAEKIQEIVDVAERVALDIRAEAETEAARYREDRRREADALVEERTRRFEELSASLSEHAERVRAEVASLSAELGRAVDELRRHDSHGPLVPVASRVTDARQEAHDHGTETPLPEGALLRAAQMAVAGNSRAEIEAALRDEFDLPDPGAIADDILGGAEAS
jgi:hypothetical protein